jgi:amidophosphoribosyltransferase
MLTSDKFRDECGVVAIYAHLEAEKLAYLGLHALQHRGQESAGIVTSDGMALHMHKSMGLVADIFQEAVLAKLPGTLAIGHTRYSTAGDSALLNAQPIMVQSNKGMVALAHNGNLVNAQDIRHRLDSQGSIFQTNSDTEVIVHLIALSKEQTLPEAIADALRRVEGAFSLVMISPDRIFAARDPRGFRPLAMGRIPAHDGEKQDTIVFASETCAFDLIGATFERDVKPGELIVVGPEGITSRSYTPALAQSSCIFEHVYYVGRTFIEPRQSVRDFGVKLKINPVRSLLEGKRVVLIDDSIVRGTTSRKIVRMVRSAGAKEVHLRISCPPTISPCFYGVDTPSKKELIGANKSVEEIREFIGADSLAYLSLPGLKKACGDGEKTSYCTACYTGIYPTNWVDVEEIQPASVGKQ